MNLNATEIGELVAELSPRWQGGQIQKIHMRGPQLLYLKLRVPGQSGVLTLSAEPTRAFLGLSDRRGESDAEASAFCMLLRGRIKGRRLESIVQLGEDRVIELRTPHAVLIVEMLGRRSALILCDPDMKVIATSPSKSVRSGLERGVEYEPPPSRGDEVPRPSRFSVGSVNEEVCALMTEAGDRGESDQRRTQLLKALKSRLTRERRRLSHIEKDLARADQRGELQRQGELLQISMGQVHKGMTSLTVPDLLSGSGDDVEISLDPRLSPSENLNKFFLKARKARRAGEVATQRQQEASRELERLEALRERLKAVDDIDEESLKEIAGSAGIPLETQVRGPKRRHDVPRLPYRAYRDCRGGRILVGRSAGDNDRLTLDIARPFDLWLHARGYHGSHVVAPLSKGTQIDGERLLDAATLAAHFSEARKNGTVEVAHTLRRYVQKPRKAPRGQVVLLREKVILLRFEEERLHRLLTARLDS